MQEESSSVPKKIKDLIFDRPLGKGAFGDVYLAHKEGKENIPYAVKIVKISILNEEKEVERHFQYEMSILKQLSHKNVITLYEIIKTKNNYYLLNDCCNGGDLLKALYKYKSLHNRPFTQEITQYLLKQVLEGVDYLHNQLKIIHRDIKLDNILINFKNKEDLNNFDLLKAEVKICDFGTAKQLVGGTLASTIVGTPYNMAPQLVQQFAEMSMGGESDQNFQYDYKADIYSLGTVCYQMVFGVRPFEARTGEELYQNQKECKFNFPDNLEYMNISEEVVDFILKMVNFDPNKRLSVKELLKQPFMTKKVEELTPYVKSIPNKSEEETAKVPPKEPEILSEEDIKIYDNLSFAENKEVVNKISGEQIYFSGTIMKYNTFGIKISRNMLITDKGLYQFDGVKKKTCFLFTSIQGISFSNKLEDYFQFVIHLEQGHDHYYLCKEKELILQFLETLVKMYKLKIKQNLQIFHINEKNLKNYVTTEKDRDDDYTFTRMPSTEELLSFEEVAELIKEKKI